MGACPTHIDVPGFIKRIASGNVQGSARVILEANVLGMSCSRACPWMCCARARASCTRTTRSRSRSACSSGYAMEDFYTRAEAGGYAAVRPAPVTHSQKIACIGGGPASLACAAELRRRGFPVSVFDNRPLPGGLTTYGIAEYKLRPSDSLREVEMIRAMGVEFHCADVGL